MNNTQIQEAIDKDKIVLFMKGTRDFPQCGFSGRIVKILEQYNAEYQEYDVLQDSELREDIKSFSDWPTIPQLYIKSEFIGGSDIVKEMYENGELKKILEDRLITASQELVRKTVLETQDILLGVCEGSFVKKIKLTYDPKTGKRGIPKL